MLQYFGHGFVIIKRLRNELDEKEEIIKNFKISIN